MKYFLVAFLCFLLSSITPAYSAQLLKVVTLNFNSETVLEDFPHNFIRNQRMPAMVSWIKENNPDIIFIAEGWNHHSFSSIADELGVAVDYDHYSFTGIGLSPIFLDSNGILVKKKFHLDQTGALKLPHSGMTITNGRKLVIPLASAAWAVGGRLTLDDGSHFYAYATHLLASNDSKRADQMQAVHELIENRMKENGEDWNTARGMIGGDFNASPDSEGIQSLVNLSYHDSYQEAHPNTLGCTFCSDPTSLEFNPITIGAGLFPVQDEIEGNNRIDYILAKGPAIQTLAATRIFTKPIDDLWMSDHYGLMSTFAINGVPDGTKLPYPNPEQDRDELEGLSSIVHVSDDNFSCDEEGCTHTLRNQMVSAERGITLFNETDHKIKIRISGDGTIWPKTSVTLSPGKVTAFFFQRSHEYQFEVSHWFTRKKLYGNFRTL